MQAVVLIIHLVICVALIGLVLLQRSEGGALGIGGGSGSLMSGRGAADTLAKMTSFAGAFFLGTSLLLTWMSGATASSTTHSIFDAPAHQSAPLAPVAPAPAPILPPAPDPTQSSAPEAIPSTQLAATVPVAPPPTTATSHAAPVVAPASTHAISTTVAGPIVSTPAVRTPPPQRTAPAVAHPTATAAAHPLTTTVTAARTQPAATAPVSTNHAGTPATLPPGVALTQTIPESDDTSQNGLEAVRHSRAGPDQ